MTKASHDKTDQKTLGALLYPVKSGDVTVPDDAEIIFLNAETGPEVVPYKARMTCVQGFRPEYDALQAAGFRVVPDAADIVEATADVVLCCLGKHKARAQADMALGLSLLKPGGVLICTGRNDAGAATLGKSAQKLGAVFQMSKYHHRIFWITRTEDALPEVCAEWLAAVTPHRVKAVEALSVPGIFGWNKVDRGSRLLAETLDERVSGSVADFGAGWGYLSREVLRNCPDVTSLMVLEADYPALQAAKQNLPDATCSANCPVEIDSVEFGWVDVSKAAFGRKFDWVITNPPFHAGKSADADIGLAFIRSAHKSLRLGGRLLLVANRHLPYEGTIAKLFSTWEIIAEDNAFKVIEARLRG